MKRAALAIAFSIIAAVSTHASPRGSERACMARVLDSEELPFAPMGYWLVKFTLEVIPPGGPAYLATLQHDMPWQAHPPRRGQTFRVWCDPADPANVHRI